MNAVQIYVVINTTVGCMCLTKYPTKNHGVLDIFVSGCLAVIL